MKPTIAAEALSLQEGIEDVVFIQSLLGDILKVPNQVIPRPGDVLSVQLAVGLSYKQARSTVQIFAGSISVWKNAAMNLTSQITHRLFSLFTRCMFYP